eukprot:7250223-Prymnesium_polylepis.1
MPCESRRMTPICEGVRPFFASLETCSTTSLGLTFSHEGGVRRYGRADLEIPLLRRTGAEHVAAERGARSPHAAGAQKPLQREPSERQRRGDTARCAHSRWPGRRRTPCCACAPWL